MTSRSDTTQLHQAPPPAASALLLSLSASFVLIGASVSMYGPLTPELVESGLLRPAWGGAVVGAHSAGALAAVAACTLATGPTALRWRPSAAALVLGGGGLVVATATSTLAVLAGAMLVGAGFGALASDLNGAALRRFTSGPVVVNGLNAAFGCGAVGAPLLLATTGARPTTAFTAIATLALLVAPLLAATSERTGPGGAQPAAATDRCRPGQRTRPPSRRLVVVTAAAAVEASLVAWGASAVIADGGSTGAASAAMSGHFAVFVLARLACVPLASRLSARVLLTGSVTLTTGSLILLAVGPNAALGLVAAGVVGATFPNALLWSMQRRDRQVSRTLGPPMVVMAAMVGGLIGSVGSGLVSEALGTRPLTVITAVAAAAASALVVQPASQARRRPPR